MTLTTAQMPAHAHGVNDPTHAHGVYDPGHGHGVNDPGDAHNYDVPPPATDGDAQGASSGASWLDLTKYSTRTTYGSGTGIWISGSGTGIGIYGAGTGISIQNNGSGQAHENMPPFLVLTFIISAFGIFPSPT